MSKMLWKPSGESVRQSNMHRFMQLVNARHHQKFDEYTPLYRWSVEHIAEFWAAMWEFAGVIHSAPYSEVADDLTKMPGTHWFPGARLNFAENLLRYRDERTALIFKGEGRPATRMTYAQLYDEVARVAKSLRALGIKPGDRVVGFMPNMPQATIAMLALSMTDLSYINELIESIHCPSREISVSIPSLRVEGITRTVADFIASVKKRLYSSILKLTLVAFPSSRVTEMLPSPSILVICSMSMVIWCMMKKNECVE